MARELIAVTRDVPVEDVEVTLTIDAVGGVTDIPGCLARIRNERQQAAELERSASRAAADLAKALNQVDVPLRDVGSILGVSHQRAHQLVTS